MKLTRRNIGPKGIPAWTMDTVEPGTTTILP